MNTGNLNALEQREFDYWIEKIDTTIQRSDLPTEFTLECGPETSPQIVLSLQTHYFKWDIVPFHTERRQWDPITNNTIGDVSKSVLLCFKKKESNISAG